MSLCSCQGFLTVQGCSGFWVVARMSLYSCQGFLTVFVLHVATGLQWVLSGCQGIVTVYGSLCLLSGFSLVAMGQQCVLGGF